MSGLRRFSSRREQLDQVFLRDRLAGARRYDRIAGYFRSSIFELVGEEIGGIERVRVVCNSDLDERDFRVAQYQREIQLKARWNELDPAVEALLHRERYLRLLELLRSGRVEIRVVPRNRVFIHGKAGVIELADGRTTSFIGSVNESRAAFTTNYEIVWEDPSPEAVAWVQEEFDALWKEAVPLPEAIITEIERLTRRSEIPLRNVQEEPKKAAPAAFVESPIYRRGEQLQPWQRSFVSMVVEHRELYGKARLLLADQVGLGKTLSMGTAAVVTALLGDGTVLILCPASLTLQWQVELWDRLGVPSAVWRSNEKQWLDFTGSLVGTNGPAEILRCPRQVGIVSTGLITQQTAESELLLRLRYGTVILDEAHRARRRSAMGKDQRGEPNNLLAFMLQVAERTRHLLLGTATPIQTNVAELWDLLEVLDRGAGFVLGAQTFSVWRDVHRALPIVKGEVTPQNESEAWEWLRSPLPPSTELPWLAGLRTQLGLDQHTFNASNIPYEKLPEDRHLVLGEALVDRFFELHNPIVRHTVLRRRDILENQGLLPRVGVRLHPDRYAGPGTYQDVVFVNGLGLLTNPWFQSAYEAAERFCESLHARDKAAGFMKVLMRQRICSSFAAGLSTARRMLASAVPDDEDENAERVRRVIGKLTPDEIGHLQEIVEQLSSPDARDPKLDAVDYFLQRHRTDGRTWLEHGCIIFSQYYDTAVWLAENLAQRIPAETIAVYAGAGKSRIYREGESAFVNRNDIKDAVARRDIRLVVATDAACEGLNLQTLGTLINVDLPWNPSRLEQRLGRIKRIGQLRETVDMLNLVYHDTQDERVYEVLSERMKDTYDIFGSLPDTIEDDWVEDAETLRNRLEQYLAERERARNAFELQYEHDIDPNAERWDQCAEVLARGEVTDYLARGWPPPRVKPVVDRLALEEHDDSYASDH
ncbi:phospholipase D-like domain-containing anti-phage protein [Tepidiforma thermophila]|uniref:SNF2 domain-containing protein n=1 Tax=Tepidiforma thermophila (strain KCTC 52669 / CGMCC 1.13589 / G233) TaxID=2761530 RepID=A0A2A9HJU0_TEPT2|nr:phospholipase D-like domain-containing anti-phage protein [Tepidiforma thermophila]PFG75315.1 SNF2 domain-containing protein [Tepidiforma thermophila]